MTFVEYLQSVRTQTQEEVEALGRKHDVFSIDPGDFYEARAHHEESHYGGSH